MKKCRNYRCAGKDNMDNQVLFPADVALCLPCWSHPGEQMPSSKVHVLPVIPSFGTGRYGSQNAFHFFFSYLLRRIPMLALKCVTGKKCRRDWMRFIPTLAVDLLAQNMKWKFLPIYLKISVVSVASGTFPGKISKHIPLVHYTSAENHGWVPSW